MDPILGEIRAVAFPFAPDGWAVCDGKVLPIRAYTALFSVLGTLYGGDGTTTFALPDLRGRAIVMPGTGQDLSPYKPGTMAGQAAVALTVAQLPGHTHSPSGTVLLNATAGTLSSPGGHYLAESSANQYGEGVFGEMAPNIVKGVGANVGENQPHENRQPFLVLNYIIALQGEMPVRP